MKKLSDSELKIMKCLWTGPKRFSEIYGLFDTTWKKQTVNTLLRRLQDKGFIRAEGPGWKTYFAEVSRETYVASIAEEVYPGAGSRVLACLRDMTG